MAAVPLVSNILHFTIILSCIITFVITTVSGLYLILSPEVPSLSLGGGALYALIPGIILLVVAMVTILHGVFGCVGVFRERRHHLLTYSMCAVILSLCIVACTGVLLSFTYTNIIKHNLNSTLWSRVNVALPNSNDTMFDIQSKYRCCGVTNGSDWMNPDTGWAQYFNNTDVPYPKSCVVKDIEYFTTGCRDKLLYRLSIVVDVSFGLSLLAAIVQVISSAVMCYGSALIKRLEHYDIL